MSSARHKAICLTDKVTQTKWRCEACPPVATRSEHGQSEEAVASHRTHTKEFYEITDSTFDLAELRQELLEWEHRYNTVRPHQALGYLTPLKFLEQQDYGKEAMCH